MLDKYRQVKEQLHKILPAMEADGGGIDSFVIDQDIVRVKLKGTCLFCPSIQLTLKHGIEKTLKQSLSWIKSVEKMD